MPSQERFSSDSRGPGVDPAEVCLLSEDAFGERTAWIREQILPHALASERLEGGLALELRDDPGVAEKLDELIRLERDCCARIGFERQPSATPGRLRLSIRGVDPDAAVFGDVLEPGHASSGARLAKAAGAGMLASVLVCCLLPIAAVALLGAVAAPLTSLDGPLGIGTGALVGGAATWWWLGRGARGNARR